MSLFVLAPLADVDERNERLAHLRHDANEYSRIHHLPRNTAWNAAVMRWNLEGNGFSDAQARITTNTWIQNQQDIQAAEARQWSRMTYLARNLLP
jgi:hypothetical protein